MDNPNKPSHNSALRRLILAAAGLAGAAGVMAAAGASHGESRNLSAIATICLAHAPALLALGLSDHGWRLRWAAMLLAGGTIVFAADLGVREWLGHGLFPGAAPLGGLAMILGWLAAALGGAFPSRAEEEKKLP